MNSTTVLSDLELEVVSAGILKKKKAAPPAEPACDTCAPPAC